MKKRFSAISALSSLLISGFILAMLMLSLTDFVKEDLSAKQEKETIASFVSY